MTERALNYRGPLYHAVRGCATSKLSACDNAEIMCADPCGVDCVGSKGRIGYHAGLCSEAGSSR